MPNPLQNVVRQDINCSYAESVITKSPSLMTNTDNRLYLPRPNPEDCKCDAHGLENRKIRYKQLSDKERRLRNELIKVNREMTNLTSWMLDNTCNINETMKSIYKMDYERRGLPIAQYRPLMAAMDSPIESPITPAIINLRDIYKDPIKFKYSAMESTIQPSETIDLSKTSETYSLLSDKPFTGCSEYMDNISKIGCINVKNQQQYLKPFLSAGKKFGNCNL